MNLELLRNQLDYVVKKRDKFPKPKEKPETKKQKEIEFKTEGGAGRGN